MADAPDADHTPTDDTNVVPLVPRPEDPVSALAKYLQELRKARQPFSR